MCWGGGAVVEGKEIHIREIMSSCFLYSNQADTSTKVINSESWPYVRVVWEISHFPFESQYSFHCTTLTPAEGGAMLRMDWPGKG